MKHSSSSSGITGQLSLESTSDNDFSASEEETVSEVSKQTGVSIDNESSVGILDLDAIQCKSQLGMYVCMYACNIRVE